MVKKAYHNSPSIQTKMRFVQTWDEASLQDLSSNFEQDIEPIKKILIAWRFTIVS